MQRLEVSCAVRRIYKSLSAKGLNLFHSSLIRRNKAYLFFCTLSNDAANQLLRLYTVNDKG